MKSLSNRIRGCLLAALSAGIILLAGCATEVGHYTLLGQSYPAYGKDHPVDIYLDKQPTRKFIEVAILDAHCESQGFMEPNLEEDAIPEFKRQARLAGCDGVMQVKHRKPKGWTLETKINHYTAVGIRYTD